MTQYRIAEYDKALTTLTQAEEDLSPASSRSDRAAAIAFQAMALHRLNRPDEARASLDRLRKLLQARAFWHNQAAQGVLREAEERLAGGSAGDRE